MKNYIIIHQFANGSSVYVGKAETFPTKEQVIDTFDIDFYPELGETLEIFKGTPKTIKIIK